MENSNYTRIIREYTKNNRLICEKYVSDDDQLHRTDGPALIEYDYDSKDKNKIWQESYYTNGKLHREGDYAALFSYNSNGRITEVQYYKNNKLHRDVDYPAHITYYDNGNKKYEAYYVNGKLDRIHENNKNDSEEILNLCSITYYPSESNKNGSIMKKEYYKNDRIVKIEDFYDNGNLESETYFNESGSGIYKNDDEPSRIEYSKDGNIVMYVWYDKFGKLIKKETVNLDLELTKSCNN